MARLNILRYPDPRLHTVAKPVAQVDERVRQLVDDMLETMYAAEGVGLAATQVDVHERVIVMDTSESHDEPRVLINPEIVAASDEIDGNGLQCITVTDVIIVKGEETRADKRMCRRPPAARYTIAA